MCTLLQRSPRGRSFPFRSGSHSDDQTNPWLAAEAWRKMHSGNSVSCAAARFKLSRAPSSSASEFLSEQSACCLTSFARGRCVTCSEGPRDFLNKPCRTCGNIPKLKGKRFSVWYVSDLLHAPTFWETFWDSFVLLLNTLNQRGGRYSCSLITCHAYLR